MGEKDFWAILIYGQDLFICQKEVFPLTHTGYEKIIIDTDVNYTIYDEKQYRGPLQNIRVELS